MIDADHAGELAAAFARDYAAWTWPQVLRAVRSVTPGEIADDLAERLFTAHPHEPRHPAPAFIRALEPWVQASPPAPRVTQLSAPAPVQALAHGLPPLWDITQLANWLDMTVEELEWFADRGSWLRQARPSLRHYRVWHREKRDGIRVIEAPKPRMRETQRRLLRRILDRVPVHSAARGFVRGSSPAAFAWPHTDRAVVIRIDLRHCFESIGVVRVRRTFRDMGYPDRIARVLAELCTTATPPDALTGVDPLHAATLRRRHLPQGAPTSPHLANLIMRRLDRRVDGYASRNGLRYTRYGDDLAVSGDQMDAGAALWTLTRIVHDEGFTVHPEKVRVMRSHQQQRLAGLVVNDAPRVPRAEYDALRALLHNATRHGAASQNRANHPDFGAYVRGRIAWVGVGSPSRRDRLVAMAAQVDWER